MNLAPDALAKLRLHDWPGNVRELENVLTRAAVLSESAILTARDLDLPNSSASPGSFASAAPPAAPPAATFRAAKSRLVSDFERDYLRDMLDRHHGNITQAARAAGKDRRAFFELMKKHSIHAHVSAVVEGQKHIHLTIGAEEPRRP